MSHSRQTDMKIKLSRSFKENVADVNKIYYIIDQYMFNASNIYRIIETYITQESDGAAVRLQNYLITRH